MNEDWRSDSERIAAAADCSEQAQTDARPRLMGYREESRISPGGLRRDFVEPPVGVPQNGPAMVGAFQGLALAIDRLEKVSATLDERTRAVRMEMPARPAVARDPRGGASPLAGAMNDLTARIEGISNRLSLIHDTLEI